MPHGRLDDPIEVATSDGSLGQAGLPNDYFKNCFVFAELFLPNASDANLRL